MPPAAQPERVSVDVRLRPAELAAAWRRDARRLLLRVREPLRVQQRVTARVTAVGVGAATTITGRVVSASREGHLHAIELAPDETRVPAMERLLAVARGDVVEFEARRPRLLATMPAVVYGPAGPRYMTTFSVSEKGCGLAWSGPVPVVGAGVDVRLGAGKGAASFRGVVCWTTNTGRATMVGVRFVSGAQHAWATMLAELERGGAPAA